MIESEGFKALQKGAKESGKLNIGSAWKTNIINATGQNQPLVPDMRVPGIITPGLRRLTIRDILPQYRTSSNLVQFTKEASFTNAAASQTAPEGTAKAESAMTFRCQTRRSTGPFHPGIASGLRCAGFDGLP